MSRRPQHRSGGPELGQPTRVHDRHPIRDLRGHAQVVGDQQDTAADLVPQRPEQPEHLGLYHDVQRGGRLVGDDQRRIPGHRHGDHHALPQPAGQLVRIAGHPASGVGDSDGPQQPLRLLRRASDLRDLAADAHRRVERRHRILEHRAEMLTPDPAVQLGRAAEHVVPADQHPARHLRARIGGDQPEQRQAQHALARPGLPDQPENLPGADPQADAAQRVNVPPAAPEGHLELVDLRDLGWLRVRGAGRG